MMGAQREKVQEQKFCNCRNSKCMKLYCECFAARQECNRLCRCADCHNHQDAEVVRQQVALRGVRAEGREGKGCSCRKSFCVKKYCECFQEGVVCGSHCKCVDCQNNETMSNRGVINTLRRHNSGSSSKNCSLYPIILSQNAEHLQHLSQEYNGLPFDQAQTNQAILELFQSSQQGGVQPVIETFIAILKQMEQNLSVEEE